MASSLVKFIEKFVKKKVGVLQNGKSKKGGNIVGQIKCPNCQKLNSSDNIKCTCGYYFNKEKYNKSVTNEQNKIEQQDDSGFFAQEKKGIKAGVVGGIIMMGIAVIWFVVGYEAGYIFYYPPILFLIGVYAFFKGLMTKKISGEKNE